MIKKINTINISKSSILFMDDTDKLTGKKLEIAKELLRNCKNFIITATDEHNLNKTIRFIAQSIKNIE